MSRVLVACDWGLVGWNSHDGLHVVPKPGESADRLRLIANEALKRPAQALVEVPQVRGGQFVVERQWVDATPGTAHHAMAALRGLPGARLIDSTD